MQIARRGVVSLRFKLGDVPSRVGQNRPDTMPLTPDKTGKSTGAGDEGPGVSMTTAGVCSGGGRGSGVGEVRGNVGVGEGLGLVVAGRLGAVGLVPVVDTISGARVSTGIDEGCERLSKYSWLEVDPWVGGHGDVRGGHEQLQDRFRVELLATPRSGAAVKVCD